MRLPAFIIGFILLLAGAVCTPQVYGQQQQSPPDAPQPMPGTPFTPKGKTACNGQAKRGDDGKWQTSSNCQPSSEDGKTPPPVSAPTQDQNAKPATEKPGTAADNPFPEDLSRKAAEKANAAENGNAANAPSADGDSSSSREKLNGIDLLGNGDHPASNGAGGFVHDPKLAVQDIHVGQFYMNTGDYKGSYVRFKEATEVDPDNAEAVFDLADAARKLDKKQEAIENYQIYLDALPKGPKAKAARKALSELNAGPKR